VERLRIPSPPGRIRTVGALAICLARLAMPDLSAAASPVQDGGGSLEDAKGVLAAPGSEAGPCPTLLRATDEMLLQAEQPKGWTELEHLPQHRLERSIGIIRVEAPADIVFAVVTDYDGFERFMPMVSASAKEGEREGKAVVRQTIKLPFPISNRHFVIEVESRDQQTRRGWRCLESRWSYVQGSGNIAEGYGRWEVLEDGLGRALVAYVGFVDPGGRLPGWAFTWATRQGLPRILQAVQREARRRAPAASVR
jgi:carbon monoxide dehydrogenase subunit G